MILCIAVLPKLSGMNQNFPAYKAHFWMPQVNRVKIDVLPSLYQIYTALNPEGVTSIIGIHPCQGRPCPVAQNIEKVLQTPYHKIEDAVKQTMEEITLESMIEQFHELAHN